jgi:TfoX/Sxy family transcriptional regulator of competence genes
MAYDEGLAERIRELLDERHDIGERKMFGGLAFLSRGHMFVGITDDVLMVRVGPDAHAAALARPHARPMDFTGKPMKGYVYVDAEGVQEDEALAAWVDAGLAFVATLPAKG